MRGGGSDAPAPWTVAIETCASSDTKRWCIFLLIICVQVVVQNTGVVISDATFDCPLKIIKGIYFIFIGARKLGTPYDKRELA